ncbi:MAG: RidA family protein [Alphaproteobacteria bacterium]|nr:RidA family protein [Alphaproteobacteria bacterium]
MSASAIQERLQSLGVTLPTPAAPVANYVPFVISGKTLYISGQLPVGLDGQMVKGQLGRDATLEQGQDAARLCAVNILAQANAALDGDLSRIARCVKLGGFVASTTDFFDHPKVINSASDLIVGALGDAGRHARFAVGVAALPFGAAVEVDAIFELV